MQNFKCGHFYYTIWSEVYEQLGVTKVCKLSASSTQNAYLLKIQQGGAKNLKNRGS